MDVSTIVDGLISYLCFLPILTFHELAHAWTAWKCGDDTARLQGRVTLNPLAHMEMLGTVILPLLAIGLSAANSQLASFIIGWGKPVPVNPYRLRHRRRDDTLVSLAGPAMNVLLAFAVLLLAKAGDLLGLGVIVEAGARFAILSLFLAFFNLLPVPPLDGSHVLKNAIGLSDETYLRFCQFGFILVIVIIQIPLVWDILKVATGTTLAAMIALVGLAG